MKKDAVYIDSDVLLDLLLKRELFYRDSQKIIALIEEHRIEGYTSSLIIANCYYIIENNKNKSIADKAVRQLRSILHVLPFTDKEIDESLNSNFKDFEDGVQYFIALNNRISTIITRNINDYKTANLKILSPVEFLELEAVIRMTKIKKLPE